MLYFNGCDQHSISFNFISCQNAEANKSTANAYPVNFPFVSSLS